jgi:predicted RNA polymerase sigma factor
MTPAATGDATSPAATETAVRAAASYRDALALAATDAERRYLTRRLAEVS